MRRIIFTFCFICLACLSFSQNNHYNVGYLLDRSSPKIDSLISQLNKEIKAVVGQDAVLEFPKEFRLINNFNSEEALKNYNTFLTKDVDLIIALGMVNNLVLSKIEKYPKPTIVFGSLSEEFRSDKNIELTPPNFTSITTSQSYTEDLKILQELASPSNVGIILEKAFVKNLPAQEVFEKIGNDLGFKIVLIPFEVLSDITSALNGIDAVYMAGGFYLSDEEIRDLANSFILKKIPSMTINPINDVENGILASTNDQSQLNQFFRHIALAVENIVIDDDFPELESRLESKQELTINYNTAEKINLPLKYSLIARTSFKGDPDIIVADKTYNLTGILKEAIANNLDLQTIQQDIKLNKKDVELANSDYLPNVRASGSGSFIDRDLAKVSNGSNPEISTMGNITLQQTIFSESANANISIQKSLLAAQKENYNSEALNTIFNTATSYFNALILKANLRIQSRNLELTKNNLKIAEENYQAGQSGRSDILRFRSELAQNTQQFVEAINQLEQGYYQLNQILNNPIDLKIDVEDTELKNVISSNSYEQLGQYLDDPKLRLPFVKFLVQEAISNAPELKSLQYNIEAAERSERLFGAGRLLPTLGLQGQYNYEFSRSGVGSSFPPGFEIPEGFYTLGLNLTLPLFNQNRQNLNKQIATIQKEQLLISENNTKLNIEKNIHDAVLELVNQMSNIQLSAIFENSAKEALDLTQTSYAGGAINIVQLIDSQNNYLKAQLASANATYNYLQSSIKLQRSLGLFFLLENDDQRRAFEQRFLQFKDTVND
jgi:outer membrane protein TolC